MPVRAPNSRRGRDAGATGRLTSRARTSARRPSLGKLSLWKAILCCLICVPLFFAWAGGSTELPPDTVRLDALSPWQGRKVSSLELEGIPESLAESARDGLALTPRSKLLGSRKAVLRLNTAQADAGRIRLLLARNGWPYSTISARAQADGAEQVKVAFAVDPGPEVVYGQVEVLGLPGEIAAAGDSVRAELEAGRRFLEAEVQGARDRLNAALLRGGYARPGVKVELERPDSTTCDLSYACRPGRWFTYSALRVEGVPEDLVPLVRKTVRLKPGTQFSPKVAADARRYVRKLQLFRQVRFTSEAADSTRLDLVADLQPRRMLTLESSVGSFTDNWFVISAGLKHRNLFQGGRGFSLEGSYAAYRITGESRVWWPALAAPRSRTELMAKYEIQDEESYRLDKQEAELSTLFEPWFNMSFRLGVSAVNGELENRSADPDAFIGDVGFQTVLNGAWYLDTSDNPLDPRSGRRFTVRADWSPVGPWTDSPFASVRGSGSQYVSLGGRRVLAARLDAATAWPLGDEADLPPDRRWFAGGVSTMRGYKRHMLGPLDSEGNPIGGQSRLLAGIEARIPVWSILGFAVFLDSGQVWSDQVAVSLNDLAVAAGGGLMIGTPVGPVRIDVAYGLTDPPSGEPRTVLQLGIGHPY